VRLRVFRFLSGRRNTAAELRRLLGVQIPGAQHITEELKRYPRGSLPPDPGSRRLTSFRVALIGSPKHCDSWAANALVQCWNASRRANSTAIVCPILKPDRD
jgi:hypothetical protein